MSAIRQRVAVLTAVVVIAGSLLNLAPAHAVTCGGFTPKACTQQIGAGVATVCVPNDWECCNTPKCARACGASWKRCMNGGSDLAVCEDTAAMCTVAAGGDPATPKFCEEPIMVTGSLTCGQPASIPGNIGWCCPQGAACGVHFPECLCAIPCGNGCCKQGTTASEDELCIEGFCKPPCPAGTHYEGQVCVCDDGQACGVGSRRTCCPDGSTCQGSRCVTPREPRDPDGNPLQNFINMINQVSGSHGGGGTRARLARGTTLGPIGSALLQLAAVNALRSAAGLAFTDHPVDPAYQQKVVAATPQLPALASGPGLDARAAAALDALLAAQAKAFAQSLASARSLARARGALRQHDLKGAGKQVRSAASFAARAAKALRGVPKLRGKAVAALTSAGVAEVDASAAEVAALQASVQTDGVPTDLAALLQGLGADADDLARLRRSLLVASTGGPALIAPLADKAQTQDLKAMAKALARFASSARRAPLAATASVL